MKSSRNIATTILATLGLSLAIVTGAQAQSTAAQTTETTPGASSTAPAPNAGNQPQSGMGRGMGPGMEKNKGCNNGSGMKHGMGQGMGHGKGHGQHSGMKGQRSELSKLITPEERTAMREKMQAAKTPEERQALRTSMRTEMEKRAKEKGITLPERKGGHQHQHQQGAQAS